MISRNFSDFRPNGNGHRVYIFQGRYDKASSATIDELPGLDNGLLRAAANNVPSASIVHAHWLQGILYSEKMNVLCNNNTFSENYPGEAPCT